MAFTVEDISRAMAGDSDITESIKQAAEKIVAMHEEDVKGLKGTNVELKEEKKQLKARYDSDLEKFAETQKDLQAQLQAAKDAAASNSPEEQKKYYDAQLAKTEETYRTQLNLKEKALLEKEALIKDLEKKDLIRSQEAEFMKEVQKTKADPIMYDVLKNMVLGQGDNFAPHDTPDGKVFWATNGSGETMKNSLDRILSSEQGKHFVMFGSTGSGAEGSSGSTGYTGANPFETGNITEQAKLYREDPKLYAMLKKQAGR